jgi:hypothetical protein
VIAAEWLIPITSPPPGNDPRSAKAEILSHLLASLLTEPRLSPRFGDSPRSMRNACQACGAAA